MKYQVGERVKYKSGDWWFYGTVTAIIENSICPGYHLRIDRMENKNCRFSITQFEFELKTDNEIASNTVQSKQENQEIIIPEIKPVLNQKPEPVPDRKRRYKKKTKNEPAFIQKPEQIPELKQDSQPELKQEVVEISVTPITEPPKPERLIRGEAWDRNFEKFKTGIKSNAIYTWITQNRKMYRSGMLSNDKVEKLKEINFHFEVRKIQKQKVEEIIKQNNSLSDAWWNHKFKQWEKGERGSLEGWRQKCVNLYKKGKLEQDKIDKLIKLEVIK